MQFHPQYADTVRRLEEALNNPRLHVFGRINTWLVNGALPEEILEIVPRVAKQGYWRGGNLNYFDGFIADAIAARTKPMPEAKPRVDSGRAYGKQEVGYEARGQLTPEARDRYDKIRADMLCKGINVMSVTPQDAARMHKRGWLTDEAAGRFGLRAV